MKYYLTAKRIFTPNQVLIDHYVLIEDGKITDVTVQPETHIPCIDLGEMNLMPGFIDTHIHGREGCDVMDASVDSLATIAQSLVKFGVTGFLPTTVTADWERTLDTYRAIAEASALNLPGAKILGAYNEGLFFSEAHKGAHNEKFFLPLTEQRIDQILQASNNLLKVMALAPELCESMDIINSLTQRGIRVMLGHTNATYDQAKAAMCAGACGGVHVFNGMSGIHHRDPGCAGAVLTQKDAYAEVIADGVHLHPVIMQLIYRQKGADKINLISDCISAGGFPDGRYALGELDVNVVNGVARTDSGSLAGSTLTLNNSVKNMSEMAEVPLHEAVNMASLIPATFLGVNEQIGSIETGKQANLVIINHNFDVQATLIEGQIAWQNPAYQALQMLCAK